MLKIMTVVGTRPELIKLSRVIPLFDQHTKHILVHTGQNFDYELNEIFFQELGLRKPDYFLDANGSTTAQTIARIIEKTDAVLEAEDPDGLLLYGDTNSCLCVIAAKRRKIPVFHMEAGNRCFDQRVPEEINRKLVDHLSDVNIVLTEHARRNLLSEGLPADRIFKSGSHMKEVLDHYMPSIESSKALEVLGIRPKEYFLVSAHREENVDTAENLQALLDSLRAIRKRWGFPVIISTHPRTRQRLQGRAVEPATDQIRFLKPFGFLDYVHLQMNAFCVLSDSGTLTEEASLLGFPAVMIRDAHERPEGVDAGSLIMCGVRPDRVLDAVRMTTEVDRSSAPRIGDYEKSSASQTILWLVTSYVDYINRVVWRREPRVKSKSTSVQPR